VGFVGAVTYFVLSARRHPGREVLGQAEEPESSSEEEVTA
jgi:hypothetical protein